MDRCVGVRVERDAHFCKLDKKFLGKNRLQAAFLVHYRPVGVDVTMGLRAQILKNLEQTAGFRRVESFCGVLAAFWALFATCHFYAFGLTPALRYSTASHREMYG